MPVERTARRVDYSRGVHGVSSPPHAGCFCYRLARGSAAARWRTSSGGAAVAAVAAAVAISLPTWSPVTSSALTQRPAGRALWATCARPACVVQRLGTIVFCRRSARRGRQEPFSGRPGEHRASRAGERRQLRAPGAPNERAGLPSKGNGAVSWPGGLGSWLVCPSRRVGRAAGD